MNIYGLQKTTLLDYPEHVAATIFTGGCNMRCPFCHNMNLVNMTNTPLLSEENVISFLKKRSNILDGVCITGGEPTLQSDLMDFIRKVKAFGYNVKLDTNGTNPSVLKALLNEQLLDYIAMDIKSSASNYNIVCGINNFDISNILESIDIIKKSSIPYEFRTTVIKEYHNSDIIEEIGKLLLGAEKYYLQCFLDSEFVPNHDLSSPDKEELITYRNQLLKYITRVEIRGIDL